MNRTGLRATRIHLPVMDCPSEERQVRLTFDGDARVRHLAFDLAARTVTVWHVGEGERLLASLAPLGYGERLLDSAEVDALPPDAEAGAEHARTRRALEIAFGLNAAFFLVEIGAGFWTGSMGLAADSLDMLADAFVYGASLFALGRSYAFKRRIAVSSGFAQIALGALGAFEVVRRVLTGAPAPSPGWMAVTASAALVANAVTMALLVRRPQGDINLRASVLFTSTDLIANAGVAAAAGVVALTRSAWPDLVAAALIFGVVLVNAARILRLR